MLPLRSNIRRHYRHRQGDGQESHCSWWLTLEISYSSFRQASFVVLYFCALYFILYLIFIFRLKPKTFVQGSNIHKNKSEGSMAVFPFSFFSLSFPLEYHIVISSHQLQTARIKETFSGIHVMSQSDQLMHRRMICRINKGSSGRLGRFLGDIYWVKMCVPGIISLS